jgi:type IV secretory pathway VirB2 component (pilin)
MQRRSPETAHPFSEPAQAKESCMNATAATASADLQSRQAQRAARLLGMLLLVAANAALAQAQGSPFMTGATSLQTNVLAWLTPIAVILVMILGAMAMANRMSWGWCLAAILGIAISFGAPQIVTWVRGLFAV